MSWERYNPPITIPEKKRQLQIIGSQKNQARCIANRRYHKNYIFYINILCTLRNVEMKKSKSDYFFLTCPLARQLLLWFNQSYVLQDLCMKSVCLHIFINIICWWKLHFVSFLLNISYEKYKNVLLCSGKRICDPDFTRGLVGLSGWRK